MKVELEDQAKEFKPIKLTITIETEEELCDLWHRTNLNETVVNKTIHDVLKYKSIHNRIWIFIDELVIDNNLRK